MLDFQKIKDDNPIEKVAERLGLELKKVGNQFRCPCPSGEGGERALVITPTKGVFYSFALQQGGDVLALVQLVNDCSVKEAAQFLVGDTVPLEKAKKPPKEHSKPSEGFAVLEYIRFDHPAVEASGLEIEIAERLGAGYCPRGIFKGKLAWPIRLPDGTLVGYIGVVDVQLPPKWHL